MSETSDYKEELAVLVQLGNNAGKNEASNVLAGRVKNIRISGISFSRALASLAIKDFVSLVKGFALYEQMTGNGAGSTSQVHRYLAAFKQYYGTDENVAKRLETWLLANRSNPYVPYGVHVPLEIRSFSQFTKYNAARARHRAKMVRIDERRSKLAKKRANKNRTVHALRKTKRERTRDALIEKLTTMSRRKQLEYIALSEYPIDFFPASFAWSKMDDISKLSEAVQGKLLRKVDAGKRGGKWRAILKKK